jgi:hypothetical protein
MNLIFLRLSAQLQQLESRLRYSKTDKDTAEKKQRILIEKDLVDFQAKLVTYEVCPIDDDSIVFD